MVYALDYEGTGGNARLENDKMRLIAFQFCQMEYFKKRMFGASGRRTLKIYFMLVINF